MLSALPGPATSLEGAGVELTAMPDCPDCGGELVTSADSVPSQGAHRVFQCNRCGETFELDEVGEE